MANHSQFTARPICTLTMLTNFAPSKIKLGVAPLPPVSKNDYKRILNIYQNAYYLIEFSIFLWQLKKQHQHPFRWHPIN